MTFFLSGLFLTLAVISLIISVLALLIIRMSISSSGLLKGGMALCLIYFFVYIVYIGPYFEKATFFESSFKGLVIDKYIDYDNHSNNTVVVKSQNGTLKLTYLTSIYQNIIVGDTIVKSKESITVYVYGKNKQLQQDVH